MVPSPLTRFSLVLVGLLLGGVGAKLAGWTEAGWWVVTAPAWAPALLWGSVAAVLAWRAERRYRKGG